MPSYTTKRRRSRQRNAARIKKSVSRDRRQLLHWSAKGTHQDYEKLRNHAKKVVHRTPSYIDQDVVTDIAENASRRMLAENVHGSSFLDGLAWTLDQVPGGNWTWIKQAVQGAMKPFRGDSLTEQDELYALLLDQSYMRIRSVSRSRLSSSSSCHRGFHPGTAVMRFGRRGWVQVTISSSQTEVSGVPGFGAKVEEAALPKSLSHAICSHWRARLRKSHIFWFRRGNIC